MGAVGKVVNKIRDLFGPMKLDRPVVHCPGGEVKEAGGSLSLEPQEEAGTGDRDLGGICMSISREVPTQLF